MDFNVTEAVELIVLLAETEQLTLQDALQEFLSETQMDSETASHLKGALFEKYSLKEMATDAVTNAMMKVFVSRPVVEEEVEAPEGNLYFVEIELEEEVLEGYLTLEEIQNMRQDADVLSVRLVEAKKSDYLETDMKKRQENNEKARKDMDKVKGQKNPHFEEYDISEERKEGESPQEYADRMKKKYSGGKSKTYDPMKDKNFDHDKAERTRGSMEEGMGHRDAETGEVTDKPEIGKTYYPDGKRQKSSVALRKEKEEREKKGMKEGLDPVGQEDGDIDNDGDHDKSDSYLLNRRKKIGDRMKAKGSDKKMKIAPDAGPAYIKKPKDFVKESAWQEYLNRRGISEEVFSEGDLIDAGRKNEGERKGKKITGEGVDNSSSVKLMPRIAEAAIVTEKAESKSQQRLFGMVRAAQQGETPASSKVAELAASVGKSDVLEYAKTKHKGLKENCCDKCGTPECSCEEKPKAKKKKAKLDEAGMPILEYSRNNADGPTPEMIDPPKDEEGKKGVKNPKGKARRPKGGDRRPNDGGSELPFDMGTVPGGGGCGC